MRLQALSLRTRLVAVAVVLVAFGIGTTGIATYFTLRGFLYGRLDQQLTSVSAGRRLFVCGDPDHPPPVQPGLRVTLLDGNGRPLSAPCSLGEVQVVDSVAVSAGDLRRLTATNSPITIRSTDGGYRAMIVGVNSGTNAGPAAAVVALSTSDISGTLAKLLALELIGGAVVVAAAGVLSAVGVRLGLRPLDRVTRTAQTVAAELSPDGSGLDRRVPVTDPDTEVGQLAEAVNTMLDAVETEYAARYESEQRMRRFLADASHELRTPLTSLRGYAELIRLRGKEGSDPDARDALRRIEAEGTRMSRLVDDLLTLARHDRGTVPEWAPVELTDVVADAVAGVHAAHPDRTITMVDPGHPVILRGDRDQLLQVARNVLTNAVTHTPDGPITVWVGESAGTATVTVRDTGPGLPPEQAAKVFDRFWRADIARTRTRGGSGLGLSIVEALVTVHGGQVSFESTLQDGTTVTIQLPAQDTAPPANGHPLEAPAAAPIGHPVGR